MRNQEPVIVNEIIQRIIEVASGGDVVALNNFLQAEEIDINTQDERGMTAAMHTAIAHNLAALATVLLARGTNVNIRDARGLTALAHLVMSRPPSATNQHTLIALNMLLRAPGIAVNLGDLEGRTPLSYAAARSDFFSLALVNILIEEGAEVNIRDRAGMTPLMRSALAGNEFNFCVLFEARDVNLNIVDENGKTGLIYAASAGLAAGTQLLLRDERTNVNARDLEGMTAFMYAVISGRRDIVKLFLRHRRVDLTATDRRGWTALIHAINEGHLEVADSLLQKGLTFSLDQIRNINPSAHAVLVYALFQTFPPELAAAYLHELEIDINTRDRNGYTPLMLAAARKKKKSLVKALLQAGADRGINMEMDGNTALTIAISNGRIGAIEALAERGTGFSVEQADHLYNINPMAVIYAVYRIFQGRATHFLRQARIHNPNALAQHLAQHIVYETPLIQAARERRRTVLRLLLQVGVDPNPPGEIPPLIYAARNGDLASVELLLEAGANASFTLPDSRSALTEALRNGHLEMAGILANYGAEITPDQGAFFVLQTFIRHSDIREVQAILRQNAVAINATEVTGRTALMMAALSDQPQIVQNLLGAGADVNLTDRDHNPALAYAIIRGSIEIIELLLRRDDIRVTEVNELHLATLTKKMEDFVNVMDRVIVYAALRPNPEFFNHLLRIGHFFISTMDRGFASDQTFIALAAAAMPDNEETRTFLREIHFDLLEDKIKIAKLRELKAMLIEQLRGQNYPNPERSASSITIAFAREMRAALGIKDTYSASASLLPEDIKEEIVESFVIASLASLDEPQKHALKMVLIKMLRDRLHKETTEPEVEESKDESGAIEEKSPLPTEPSSSVTGQSAEQLQSRSESKRYDDERIEPESPYR